MDEEFALCWNNFQDNIQTGFQNLYDRGDLVDVTLAMDGKLLHAHKIVLAICSPYFQEMFNTNPCKHPIIILKDVSFSVMCELLQFMYQGVVNVKHTELSSFMKIAQMLQIKGLATAPTSSGSQIQKSPDDLTSSALSINTNSGHNGNNNNNNSKTSSTIGGNRINNSENSPSNNNSSNTEAKISLSEQQQQQQTRIPISENSSSSISSSVAAGPSLKRLNEFSSESLSVYSRKLTKRTLSELSDNEHLNQNNDSMDHMNPDDVFLPPIPHISIGESPRFDLNNVKREFLAAGGGSVSSGATEHHHSHHLSSPSSSGVHHPTSPGSVRNSLPPPFNFEYNMYAAAAAAANKLEYPNDLHLNSDFTKGGSSTANHMDIPPGMLFAPGERWFHGKLEFMLSQRGKPLLVHDGHTFGIQYIRKDKKYWQCNLSRKFNCKARVTTTDTGEIIVTNNEHCHTEIRQHLRKDYQRNKLLTAINHTLQERLAANNSALSSSVGHNSGSNSNNNNHSNIKNHSSNNREDAKNNFVNNRLNRSNDDINVNPNSNSIWQPKTEMIPDISFK